MAVKPIYQENLNKLGCCGGGSNGDVPEQLTELQKKVEEQSKQIDELKNNQDEKITLTNVYSLGGEPIFQAHPLGDKQGE